MGKEIKDENGKPSLLERSFEQPTDALSFYSDLAQVIHTGNEILLQFYETIPGAPSNDGNITKVKSRLKATITISMAHAQNIGKLLIEKGKLFEVKQ